MNSVTIFTQPNLQPTLIGHVANLGDALRLVEASISGPIKEVQARGGDMYVWWHHSERFVSLITDLYPMVLCRELYHDLLILRQSVLLR